MKQRSLLLAVLTVMLLIAARVQATPILDVNSVLTGTDSIQLGRLSRNGIPQDWTDGEPFPGVINPTTAYRYHTYVVNVGTSPFVQISVDSVSTNTFFSAYDTSYNPDSAGAPNLGFDTHWLGDAGISGNFFGIDPLFFQVLVPLNHNLVVVVNGTGVGISSGIGDPFHLLVEGFVDSQFTDAPVPEPATVFLCGGGLVLAAVRRRAQRRTARRSAVGLNAV